MGYERTVISPPGKIKKKTYPMTNKYLRLLLASSLLLSLLFVAYYSIFPDVARLKKWHPSHTSFMEYRQRQWEQRGERKKFVQTWVSLSQVSPYVIKAVLIAEDDKFWRHEGFDFEALQKALVADLKKRKFRFGGSTISQQLVKNLYLSPVKNPLRKIKEAVITWRLERALSKKRIIELYLNVAEWGDGLFGIEAAARHYYGKAASQLTALEAARLASVLPNPLKYQPTAVSKYVEKRGGAIYRIMVKRGVVIPEYVAIMKDPGEATPTEGVSEPEATITEKTFPLEEKGGQEATLPEAEKTSQP